MENRDLYFEKLRGLAIIAVVMIHTITMSTNLSLVFRQFVNFAVAFFFFMSGYFIKKNIFEIKGSGKKFIVKRLKRILIPYFIWSLLSLIFIQRFYHFNYKMIILNLLTGQTVNIYYFIIVMAQFIIITPILIKYMNNKIVNRLLWLVTPVSLLVLYILNLVMGKVISFPYYALPFTIWFLFYYYGIIVGNDSVIEAKIVKKLDINVTFYIICIALSIVEGYILFHKFGLMGFASSQIKISSFLASFFFINMMLGVKKYLKAYKFKFLVTLGNYSFGIYLIHIFVIKIINKSIRLLNLDSLYSPIITLTTIVISWFIIIITINVIGQKKSKDLLGF